MFSEPIGAEPVQAGNEAAEVGRVLKDEWPVPGGVAIEMLPSVRLDDLFRHTRSHRPQVVHFTGHGEARALQLEDTDGLPVPLPGGALAQVLSHFGRRPRLVMLSACQSLPLAEHVARASACDCAVGYPTSIERDPARSFAQRLYASLAAGEPVQRAFEQACIQLESEGCPTSRLPKLVVADGVDPARVFVAQPLHPPSVAMLVGLSVAALGSVAGSIWHFASAAGTYVMLNRESWATLSEEERKTNFEVPPCDDGANAKDLKARCGTAPFCLETEGAGAFPLADEGLYFTSWPHRAFRHEIALIWADGGRAAAPLPSAVPCGGTIGDLAQARLFTYRFEDGGHYVPCELEHDVREEDRLVVWELRPSCSK